MEWFGSIHVRTQSVEYVAAALRLLKQEDCYVGKSGANWVGIYDKRNEDKFGMKFAELSSGLSLALQDVYVLGFLQAEDAFKYWLYRGSQQLDIHPPSPIKGMLFLRRAILDLCATEHDKKRVYALLDPKTVAKPIDYSMTDEELMAEIERNRAKAKTRAMSGMQRPKRFEGGRKVYPTDRYAIEVLSKILGIEYYWLRYSDFSPYDLPPSFVHVDYRLP